MPHLGINAMIAMHEVITELQKMKIDFVPHPQLGGCSMSINTISGGKATNIVPDECTLTVDMRTLPGQQSEAVVAQVQEILDRLGAADPSFKASLAITRNCPALETSADEPFVKSVCGAAGQAEPGPVSYTTDGPYFAQLGPVVILGPGKPQMCHQPDEYVDIAEVHRARQVYSEIIRKLLVE
jgi:succinyl-diaminopimelate desuccinylase